jgi:hypothetical protein
MGQAWQTDIEPAHFRPPGNPTPGFSFLRMPFGGRRFAKKIVKMQCQPSVCFMDAPFKKHLESLQQQADQDRASGGTSTRIPGLDCSVFDI